MATKLNKIFSCERPHQVVEWLVILEMSVYSPLNQLTWLLAREHFTEFSHHIHLCLLFGIIYMWTHHWDFEDQSSKCRFTCRSTNRSSCQPKNILLKRYIINPYPTAFPYGNGMVLHFYQQQESSMTKTIHKVINKGLKAYVQSLHTGENFH